MAAIPQRFQGTCDRLAIELAPAAGVQVSGLAAKASLPRPLHSNGHPTTIHRSFVVRLSSAREAAS